MEINMENKEIINISLEEICELFADEEIDYKKLSITLLKVINDLVDKYNNLVQEKEATKDCLTKLLRRN